MNIDAVPFDVFWRALPLPSQKLKNPGPTSAKDGAIRLTREIETIETIAVICSPAEVLPQLYDAR
jgi:hypothetical protein